MLQNLKILKCTCFIFLWSISLSAGAAKNQKSTWNAAWENPRAWQDPEHSRQISRFLSCAEILEKKLFKTAATHTIWRLTLQDQVQVLFKVADAPEEAEAEVAAYRFSRTLGFPLVPPTVQYKIDGQLGSLHLFVDQAYPASSLEEIHDLCSKKDLERLKLFWFLMGHWDTHRGNLLFKKIQGQFRPISIDHEDIVIPQHTQYAQRPFIQRGQAASHYKHGHSGPFFPFEAAQILYPPFTKQDEEEDSKYPLTKKLARILDDNPLPYRKLPFRYVIHNGYVWQQQNFENPHAFPCFTQEYTRASKQALVRINKRNLSALFEGMTLKNQYIQRILERRNMMLRQGELVQENAIQTVGSPYSRKNRA